MATYRVQAPDGAVYQLEGADDADPSSVIAQVMGNHSGATTTHTVYDPTEGMSTTDKFLAGAGKGFSDLGLGAQQLWARAADYFDPRQQNLSGLVTGQPPQSRVDELRQEVAESRKLDAPLMRTTAGKVGDVTGNVAAFIPASFIPGANTYTGAAALGALSGLLSPSETTGEAVQNTALGGGLGLAGKGVTNAVAKWLKPRTVNAQPALTDAQQNALAGGASVGMRATPGQQLGSVPLQQLEAKLSAQPWTSGPLNSLGRSNQQALNRTVANAIGEDGTSVDSTVLANAKSRLSDVFESARSPDNIVMVDPDTTSAVLNRVDNDFTLPGKGIRDNAEVAKLESLLTKGSGSDVTPPPWGEIGGLNPRGVFKPSAALAGPSAVNGQQLGGITSRLGKAAYTQMTSPSGNRDLGKALYAVKDHVDDLIQSSLSDADAATYGEARRQYRNLMMITSRAGIVNPSSGNVSGTALASKLQQADKNGFLFGGNQSPMYQAARFSQAFKPSIGDSGTATRSWNPMEWAVGAPAWAASRAYMSQPGVVVTRSLLSGSRALGPAGAAIGNRVPQLSGLLNRAPSAGLLLPYLQQQQ